MNHPILDPPTRVTTEGGDILSSPHLLDNLLGRSPAHVKEEDDRQLTQPLIEGAQSFADESAKEAQLQRNRDNLPQAHATT